MSGSCSSIMRSRPLDPSRYTSVLASRRVARHWSSRYWRSNAQFIQGRNTQRELSSRTTFRMRPIAATPSTISTSASGRSSRMPWARTRAGRSWPSPMVAVTMRTRGPGTAAPSYDPTGPRPPAPWPGVTGSRSLLVELERAAVDAVADPCRVRAVVEHVAQVPAAARAQHLGASHAVAHVALGLHGVALGRLVEARPARAGRELRVRAEQLGAAAGTPVGAARLLVVVLVGPGSLGALAAQNLVLLRRQLAAPFLVVLVHLGRHAATSFEVVTSIMHNYVNVGGPALRHPRPVVE